MLVPRRSFGAAGVELSALAFGTMRLAPPKFDAGSALALLLHLSDHGVTSFHVSHEYESHPFACEALAALRAARPAAPIELIAKIGAPHFDETGFSGAAFRARIEALLQQLPAGRVDVVQWMVRHTPNEDAPRLAILRRDRDAVAEAAERLKAEGKIGALGMFPYSEPFRAAALCEPFVDGLVDYLNPSELEAAPWLDAVAARGQGFVALRPLFAGALAHDPARVDAALRFPLLHPATAAIVVSLSDVRQADQAIAAAHTAPDPDAFRRALA
ncbi:aldo/keto reductase [Phenylobacterium sp.]|jgi:aryl-alcohol dehydrogenase-like predicted oxidoreductase|uniref:aldo/keto reductase n=1 Tax=Phenylobacterium sp. TaxID=1871053 RepID=UPI002F42E505